MKYWVLILTMLFMTACDSNQAEQKTEQDNPLLKMQNETVEKAQNAINEGLENQQRQLDAVDQ